MGAAFGAIAAGLGAVLSDKAPYPYAQRHLAVARAPASRPEIIFADESTGNLDSRAHRGAHLMRRAVDQMHQTIIMVPHDPTAASYADRIVVLGDGRIVDEMHEPTLDLRTYPRARRDARGGDDAQPSRQSPIPVMGMILLIHAWSPLRPASNSGSVMFCAALIVSTRL